jgi:alkylation response protein AidB-like acyl-CoA dehydrogenase
MDLNYSTEEAAFRDEVRGWLKDNLPEDLRRKTAAGDHLDKDDLLRWHKILAKKGWVAPAWPEEWGGPGWNVTQRYIFEEECGLAGTPPIVAFGVTMCAQVLLKFGSPEQKKRHLPAIYNGDVFWVQGYSEPGSGSDLASLKTRADRRGDKYVVNGQKIWTTLGQYGDWIFCLVRTDFESKIRQEGISFLLIDMKTPGITVRPLILMDGGHEVNEVFFDNVEVPVENLVHEEGKGWTVAKYLLGHERLNTGRIGGSKRELAKLKQMAARTQVNGKPPGADVSMLKIRGTEIQQALTELMMQAAGPMAAPFKPTGPQDAGDFDDVLAHLAPRYANYRKTSIYAGSNEIQRNIIAKATLGL